jgi:hypothetical protein
VQVEAEPRPARAVALQLATALQELEPTVVVGPPDAWLPPSHAAWPPPALDGARIAVELPQDTPESGGCRTVFHVVTFGGLQHVLLARGSAAGLRAHRAEVDALLASYMLLEADCDLVEAASRPLRHHTGGELHDGHYRNTEFGLEMRGPASWKACQQVGGAAFRVVWTSPLGSRLWLIGLAVPPGLEAWDRETAERWLEHLCQKHGVVPDEAGAPAGVPRDWVSAVDCDDDQRTLVLAPRAGADPASPSRRWLHVRLRPDLLVVIDAFGITTDDEAAVREAMTTLRRR